MTAGRQRQIQSTVAWPASGPWPRLGHLGVPVLGGIEAGHNGADAHGNADQICLPIGSMATMDTEAGTLTIESPVRVPDRPS